MNLVAGLTHYQILSRLAKDARSYLEVGTYEGGSLVAVLDANPRIREVVCVDSWAKRIKEGKPPGHEHIDEVLSEMGYRGEVQFFEGESRRMLPRIAGPFDLTVVDGSHKEGDCYDDLRLVWPKTARTMVVHDIWTHMGVRTAFWRFLRAQPEGSARVTFCAGDHGTMVVARCST